MGDRQNGQGRREDFRPWPSWDPSCFAVNPSNSSISYPNTSTSKQMVLHCEPPFLYPPFMTPSLARPPILRPYPLMYAPNTNFPDPMMSMPAPHMHPFPIPPDYILSPFVPITYSISIKGQPANQQGRSEKAKKRKHTHKQKDKDKDRGRDRERTKEGQEKAKKKGKNRDQDRHGKRERMKQSSPSSSSSASRSPSPPPSRTSKSQRMHPHTETHLPPTSCSSSSSSSPSPSPTPLQTSSPAPSSPSPTPSPTPSPISDQRHHHAHMTRMQDRQNVTHPLSPSRASRPETCPIDIDPQMISDEQLAIPLGTKRRKQKKRPLCERMVEWKASPQQLRDVVKAELQKGPRRSKLTFGEACYVHDRALLDNGKDKRHPLLKNCDELRAACPLVVHWFIPNIRSTSNEKAQPRLCVCTAGEVCNGSDLLRVKPLFRIVCKPLARARCIAVANMSPINALASLAESEAIFLDNPAGRKDNANNFSNGSDWASGDSSRIRNDTNVTTAPTTGMSNSILQIMELETDYIKPHSQSGSSSASCSGSSSVQIAQVPVGMTLDTGEDRRFQAKLVVSKTPTANIDIPMRGEITLPVQCLGSYGNFPSRSSVLCSPSECGWCFPLPMTSATLASSGLVIWDSEECLSDRVRKDAGILLGINLRASYAGLCPGRTYVVGLYDRPSVVSTQGPGPNLSDGSANPANSHIWTIGVKREDWNPQSTAGPWRRAKAREKLLAEISDEPAFRGIRRGDNRKKRNWRATPNADDSDKEVSDNDVIIMKAEGKASIDPDESDCVSGQQSGNDAAKAAIAIEATNTTQDQQGFPQPESEQPLEPQLQQPQEHQIEIIAHPGLPSAILDGFE